MDQQRRAVYVVDETNGTEVLEIFLGRDWEKIVRRAERYRDTFIRHTGHAIRLMEVDLMPGKAREHCPGQ